jgi:UDP-3-O-[3-hydroxymyristoyl] glucosamine N-acyltransferase
MGYRVGDIAQALAAEAAGDLDLVMAGAAEPAMAGPDDLAIAMDPRYAEGLSRGRARAALLWPGADWRGLGLQAAIFAPRARLAMAGLTRMMDPGITIAPGIHAMTVIDPTAQIGPGAAIGPFVTIGARAVIGPGTRIAGHVSIGDDVRIGPDALILQGVHIGARVTIGARFICQPGAVIAGDGFSFVTPEKGAVEEVRQTLGQRGSSLAQAWVRIHSLGAVTIGDDVEVGSNTCIDRGTIRDTSIGRGTKLDNMVQIGHNVQIGEDCLLCGHAGVAGSSRLGNRVVVGGKAGVSDNITVGDDVIIGAGSIVLSTVPAGRAMLGYPATQMSTQIEIHKALRRLPRLAVRVTALEAQQTDPEGTP